MRTRELVGISGLLSTPSYVDVNLKIRSSQWPLLHRFNSTEIAGHMPNGRPWYRIKMPMGRGAADSDLWGISLSVQLVIMHKSDYAMSPMLTSASDPRVEISQSDRSHAVMWDHWSLGQKDQELNIPLRTPRISDFLVIGRMQWRHILTKCDKSLRWIDRLI